MTQVEFHFDFGSPNAYLAHKLILGIEQRSGAAFVYVKPSLVPQLRPADTGWLSIASRAA